MLFAFNSVVSTLLNVMFSVVIWIFIIKGITLVLSIIFDEKNS